MSHNEMINSQESLAKNLYENDPDFCMRIAMGEENTPKGILSAAVYAKVCEEVEKNKDIDTCMRLANSHRNTKISCEAQSLKFRNPDSPIEVMKGVVNARRKAYEKTLPKGKTYEMAVADEMEEIKKEMKKTEPTEQDMLDFIDSLTDK